MRRPPNDGAREISNAHYLVGEELRALGEIEHALQHFGMAVDRDPTYVAAYLKLGAVLSSIGDRESIAVIREALRLDPTDVITWAVLGVVYEGLGDFNSAVSVYREGIEIVESRRSDRRSKQPSAHLHVQLGKALNSMGARTQARAEWELIAKTEGKRPMGEVARMLLAKWPESSDEDSA